MVEKLYLGYNPWTCDCEMSEFVEYLRTYVERVDSSQIRCETTGEEIIKLNKHDLCTSNKKLILILSISVLVLFVLASCATALYFKFKKQILIWLYNYGLCLCLVDEDEIDEDKIYDAFISYSHHDEDFVLNNIVSNLETGPDPYKLCVHVRDFIPGEYIKTQITNSIRTSKRTIVFLSPSFLESVWGKLEFKTAHTEAMLEGRARVIIVVYGDVNLKMVDDDLKSHINANTYVKWDDPWFWRKLKYALPKRRRRTSKNGTQPQRVADPSIVSVPNKLEEESLTSLMRNNVVP
ncbi:hypothetical protein WA026_011592 [Henosepilachna vigintioctopunctata]|uniref:TIR domain-containing protein n=1 Tax=Henosepilachna vigintioctopunctata TaxID=420089 RepID=A0AAW1TU39_9CUCU